MAHPARIPPRHCHEILVANGIVDVIPIRVLDDGVVCLIEAQKDILSLPQVEGRRVKLRLGEIRERHAQSPDRDGHAKEGLQLIELCQKARGCRGSRQLGQAIRLEHLVVLVLDTALAPFLRDFRCEQLPVYRDRRTQNERLAPVRILDHELLRLGRPAGIGRVGLVRLEFVGVAQDLHGLAERGPFQGEIERLASGPGGCDLLHSRLAVANDPGHLAELRIGPDGENVRALVVFDDCSCAGTLVESHAVARSETSRLPGFRSRGGSQVRRVNPHVVALRRDPVLAVGDLDEIHAPVRLTRFAGFLHGADGLVRVAVDHDAITHAECPRALEDGRFRWHVLACILLVRRERISALARMRGFGLQVLRYLGGGGVRVELHVAREGLQQLRVFRPGVDVIELPGALLYFVGAFCGAEALPASIDS